jgi:hypothetical protein
MKNQVLLENYYLPGELEARIAITIDALGDQGLRTITCSLVC